MTWFDIKFKISWWLNGSPKGKHWKWGRIGEIAAWTFTFWGILTAIWLVLGFVNLFIPILAILNVIWFVWIIATAVWIISFIILFSS